MNFESRVLALVGDPAYAPLTLKAISRRLKVDVEAYPEFRSTVKGLVRSGRLDFAKDKTLTMPDTSGSIVGTFRRTSKGFGFVRPSRGDRADQIYIPVDAG